MTITDQPLQSTTPAPAWTAVCSTLELEPLWGEAALLGVTQIALFLLPDGTVRAVSNLDPATGAAVMSRGIVGSRRIDGADRPTIASPLHKDIFDLETGRCYTKDDLNLPIFDVRIVDDQVEVAWRPALVAASHGTADVDGQRAVAALVDAVEAENPGITVRGACVDVQLPDVPDTIATLPVDQPVTIVPLLLSAGFHVYVDLAEAAEDAARPGTVTAALGPDPRLATVLARRLAEAGFDDGDRIVLAAAGSTDARAVADCHATADLLSAQLGRPVVTSFISAALPRVADAVEAERTAHPGQRVCVATYLLAPGYFATLAAAAGADVTSAPLLTATDAPPQELVDIVGELYRG